MAKELLYTIASDSKGNFIHINEAVKGQDYYCVECKDKLILRKSGNTGKGSKRPHFAHNNLTSNCTPEGVLHKGFKTSLVNLLRKQKEEGSVLLVNWKCEVCWADYSRKSINRNLLEKVVSIEEEYNLQSCRPDIALLDADGSVIGVIEIVVSHAPEENALSYYEQNGITLIQINLSSQGDLLKVEEKVQYPDLVNLCLEPRCPSFKNHVVNRDFQYYKDRCGSHMHTLYRPMAKTKSVFGSILSENLMKGELEEAESKGIQFRKEKNKNPVVRCLQCEQRYRMARARYGGRRL